MKIAAMSDLHGHLPTIPKCDLLLVGGDICPDRPRIKGDLVKQSDWFLNVFKPYLPDVPMYGTWGNHDWLQRQFESDVMKVDELVEVNGLKIWFSPWSNQFGNWAWMDDHYNLQSKYDLIPECVDIIVSHQPPYGYGDTPDPRFILLDGQEHVGSRELLDAINRVKPKIVICGHIHGGSGYYHHYINDEINVDIYNVSVVDEAYALVHPVTEITIE